MDRLKHALGGVSETLLMTLYARASEAQRPNSRFHDPRAVELVERLEMDVARLHLQRHDTLAVVMRLTRIDRHARDFLAHHPGAGVVHIGCGLDTRFDRLDDGRVEWFDLDMPDVMALRSRLLPCDNPRYHALSGSVFEPDWAVQVSPWSARPFLFIAEGVLVYFPPEQVQGLFLALRDRFPGCELVCDEQSPFMVWANNLQLAAFRLQARLHWGMRDPREAESWGAGIRLLDRWDYLTDEESPMREIFWLRLFPGLLRSSTVCRYRLGEPAAG